jgi:hypothetical protein
MTKSGDGTAEWARNDKFADKFALRDQLDGTIARDVISETSLLFGADLGFHEEWLRDEP